MRGNKGVSSEGGGGGDAREISSFIVAISNNIHAPGAGEGSANMIDLPVAKYCAS